MKNTVLTSLLILLIGFTLTSFGTLGMPKQNVGIYSAADNSGKQIKILEGNYGVSEVYIYTKDISKWIPTEILSIDTIQEYIKVKSLLSNAVFELFIDWNNQQIILVDQQQTKTTFWLEKA